MSRSCLRLKRTTPLGDTVMVTATFVNGRIVREDIELSGPPELVEIPRSTFGRTWPERS